MFDELKGVKFFQESYNVKYVKEVKRLKNLHKAHAYLESK